MRFSVIHLLAAGAIGLGLAFGSGAPAALAKTVKECNAEYAAQKDALKKLSPEAVSATTMAGDAITAKLTNAPGNHAAIGGLKVTTSAGWFAARPSGTENIYKLYAESFRSQKHLDEIVSEAQEIVKRSL